MAANSTSRSALSARAIACAELALELLRPRLRLLEHSGADPFPLDFAGELAQPLLRGLRALLQCRDLLALLLELAGQRRPGLDRRVALGERLRQRRLRRRPGLVGLDQLCSGVVAALLALELGHLLACLLDLELERRPRARRRLALRSDRRPGRLRLGARLLDVGSRRLGIGPSSLQLGPRGVGVCASALDLGSRGFSVVAEPLPDQRQRAFELFGSLALAP